MALLRLANENGLYDAHDWLQRKLTEYREHSRPVTAAVRRPHCESCGRPNPEMNDGYTTCCNELVCTGSPTHRFGVPGNFVGACCWAMAERIFEAEGREIPEGSSR